MTKYELEIMYWKTIYINELIASVRDTGESIHVPDTKNN